jgi:hypothetical protein
MNQVIVYRNPIEAAFWNSTAAGDLFPILAGIAVFFTVFILMTVVLPRVPYRYKGNYSQRSNFEAKIAIFVGAVAAVFTVAKMWI